MSQPMRETPIDAAAAPYRALRLGPQDVALERGAGGVIYVRSTVPLPPYAEKLTERLDHWAAVAPERTFIAQRDETGAWRELSYAETRRRARRIAAGLLARGLSPERPLAILSGNDIEHALLGLGAYYAGIPYAPISPAYSLISTDFGKLRFILDLITPGLVFACDGAAYGRAIAAVVPPDTELVVTRNPPAARPVTAFDDLLTSADEAAVDAAHAAVGPDTIAKFLFTSGSTGSPKGVINTQRMICANQVMLNTALAFMQDEPPVIVDWLPWNHTFGGNHNVGLVLYNGGSLYIDDGKPTPAGIHETVRNLREIAPTIYFNVPKGYEALLPHLRREPALRERFFSRLRLNFFSGAGMAKYLWDALDEIAVETCGERILMLTGLGATESAPFAIWCNKDQTGSGRIGLPAPGVELKLVPVDGKLEARLRGPNITPGYWRQPDLTAALYDKEGFYRMGDAVRFVDPDDHTRGLLFDGRISEDFKLATGTWVSVGPLRAQFIGHFAPYVRDVVIAGLDRGDVRVLVFPDLDACRELAELPAAAETAAVLNHPRVRALFADRLASLAAQATGSSNRIVALMLLEQGPSIDRGEMTDKGSINQRAVLAHRDGLVEELYAGTSPHVIALGEM